MPESTPLQRLLNSLLYDLNDLLWGLVFAGGAIMLLVTVENYYR